jgi:hypothetical protein
MERLTRRQFWQRPARWSLYPIAVLLLILMVYLVNAANAGPAIPCTDPTGALPDPWIFVAGIAGVVVGRLAAWPRYEVVPPDKQGAARIEQPTGSRILGALGLAGFFLAAAAALYFEAVAVENVGGVAPITHYIRCAIVYDKTGSTHGLVTYGVVVVVCYLAGHWLWSLDRAQSSGPPPPQ